MLVTFSEKDILVCEKCVPLEELRGRQILIAGAGGLIGSALVGLLLELDRKLGLSIDVYALGRDKEALERRFSRYIGTEELHIEEADVVEYMPADMRPDFIIHGASPASPIAYAQTPVDVMRANFLGTLRLLDLARESGGRLLFASSGEIYGSSDDPDAAFTEEVCGSVDPMRVRSCYPESKRAAETLCASYWAQFGVSAMAARLCYVYGPSIAESNTRADAQFLRDAVSGREIVMKSRGTQVRSYCYVKDAAIALLSILLKGQPGQAYNVAARASVASIREYAETLAEIAGVNVTFALPSEEEARGYTTVQRAVLDPGKLEALGWKSVYSLRDGLYETYQQAVQTSL